MYVSLYSEPADRIVKTVQVKLFYTFFGLSHGVFLHFPGKGTFKFLYTRRRFNT